MSASMRQIDEEALTALGGELVHLAQGIRLAWLPAAERLKYDRLLGELQAATASDSPGTLRSLARAVGECLAAVRPDEEGR